jgi:hypothetical protein
MSFRVPKNLTSGQSATITDINMNFASVEAELNALFREARIKAGSVTTSKILDSSIALSGNILKQDLATGTDSDVPSCNAVLDYIIDNFGDI